MLKIKLLLDPCCKFEYKMILYIAEKKEINITNINNINLIELRLIIKIISPNKL